MHILNKTELSLQSEVAPEPKPLSWEKLATEVVASFGKYQVLSSNKDKTVIRISLPGDLLKSVICKIWHEDSIWKTIKHKAGISSAIREHKNLVKLKAANIEVPSCFSLIRITSNKQFGICELLFMEDLGNLTTAIDFLKNIEEPEEILAFENKLIYLTQKLVSIGYIDSDHSLVNLAVTKDGRLVKIDLELGSWNRFSNFIFRNYSKMLARFISSYIYAVQPNRNRVSSFISKLSECIPLNVIVKASARQYILKELSNQKKQNGIDNKYILF